MTENQYKMKELNFTKSLDKAKEGFIYYKSGINVEDISWGDPTFIIKYKEVTLKELFEEVIELTEKNKALELKNRELEDQIKSLTNTEIQELRIVISSLAERLKKLEDETDII